MRNTFKVFTMAAALAVGGMRAAHGGVIIQSTNNVAGSGTNTWSYLVVEGEDYDSELDDSPGTGFTRVDNSGAITTPSGSVILPANTTASHKAALYTASAFGRHIDKVTYKLQFALPGTYYLYMRFTMFENADNGTYLNEDSFFLPPDFNKDPQTDWPLSDANGQTGGYVEGCCDAAGFLYFRRGDTVENHSAGDEEGRKYWEGNFHWNELITSQFLNAETQGEPRVRLKYEVTPEMAGKPLDFTISYREGGLTVDSFLFSTSPDLMQDYNDAQFDQAVFGTAGGKVATQTPAQVVGTGTNAWSYLIVEGEDFARESDEDPNAGFTRVDANSGITTLSGSTVLATNTAASGGAALYTATAFGRHIDKVTYNVQFARPGTYYLYMRFTMFENAQNGTYLNEDSFFLPPDFNKDPQTDWPLSDANGQTGGYVEGCCDAAGFLYFRRGDTVENHSAGDEEGRKYWEGNFHWNELISSQFLNAETQGEPRVRFQFEVKSEMIGKPQQFTVSYREGGVTIDLFLFSTNPDLMAQYDDAQLDSLLLSGNSGGSAPQLTISRSGNNVLIAWPANATGYVLEASGALGSANWTPVGDAPVAVGGQNTVTVPATAGAKFYRLRK